MSQEHEYLPKKFPLSVAPPPRDYQPLLIDAPAWGPDFQGSGEVRARCGLAVQEILTQLMGLTTIPHQSGYDVVYDAYCSGTYYEIKSVRSFAKSPIYDWRLEKDSNCGHPVVYVFGVHRCRRIKNSEDLWSQLARTLDYALVVPLEEILRVCQHLPLNKIKTTNGESGYSRPGYREGYRNLPIGELPLSPIGSELRGKVRGHEFKIAMLESF